MTNEEVFQNQSVWTAFFNKPITKVILDDLLIGVTTRKIVYIGEVDLNHSADASWHTVIFSDIREVNKIRAILLLEGYQSNLQVTDSHQGYLDCYPPNK